MMPSDTVTAWGAEQTSSGVHMKASVVFFVFLLSSLIHSSLFNNVLNSGIKDSELRLNKFTFTEADKSVKERKTSKGLWK